MNMDSQNLISSEEVRNWAELPFDVLSHIFLKLRPIEILVSAQSVCSTWRRVSKEPLLFRSIRIGKLFEYIQYVGYDITKILKEAVDRSCGQLVELSVDTFGSNKLLAHIAKKSGSLTSIRLVCCFYVSDDALINLAKKAVMLEELQICHCSFSRDILKTIGKACPRLKSFRLTRRGSSWPHIGCDDEALAIAENMPQLHHLHLFGLTTVGLRAILNGCMYLESIDLRGCYNLNLEGDLLKSCTDRLIKLRLPNDSHR